MKCPQCDGSDTRVIETRLNKTRDIVRRRRCCQACDYRFTTQEEIIRSEFGVIKSDGRREDFNIQKLRHSLGIACRKRPVNQEAIDSAVKKIQQDLEEQFDSEAPSQEIGGLVMQRLRELDEVAYVRFASVYRQFKDAAEFVAEIQALYETKK